LNLDKFDKTCFINMMSRALRLQNLEGPFPSPIANSVRLQKLLIVHLDDNKFTGPIPDFSASSKLMNVTLEGNQFSGTIPAAMCNLTRASNNFTLKALWADCIVCPVFCCTRCFPNV
jgi:hypothetical protein